MAVRKQAPVAAVSDRRTAVGTPPLQDASVAASLSRHGGVKPPLQDADLKVGATKPGNNSGLQYYRVPENWRKEEKLQQLTSFHSVSGAMWQPLKPDASANWLVPEHAAEFETLVPLGSKVAKAAHSASPETVFKIYSRGVATCRDEVAYDFDKHALQDRVRRFIDDYNGEVDRYKRSGRKQSVDEFVRYDKIKWSGSLKLNLERGAYAAFDESKVRIALYRPFCRRYLFFDRFINERVYVMPSIFPAGASEAENRILGLTSPGSEKPFMALAVTLITDLHLVGAGASTQGFSFYVYDEDGSNRCENITNWALEYFRKHYKDKNITKWDIFYYVYGVLHHPEYRAKYAENLKRELPRIPLVGACHSEESRCNRDGEKSEVATRRRRTTDPSASPQDDRDVFWTFSKAGKELARLHIDYEKLEPWPLKYIETSSGVVGASGARPPAERRSALQIPLSYRVEDKMRLAKDHRTLKVNDSLTMGGIPPETFEYRLGNRSSLEWVIDQYQVTEDKHSGICSDPNRADDPEYIVRLVGQVIRVSLETVKIVKSLPCL